jgi:hypothetical protein
MEDIKAHTYFLEFDSSYRDRTSWPLAGEFDMPLAVSGNNSSGTAVDPVSNSAPVISWTGSRFDNDASPWFIVGVIPNPTTSNSFGFLSTNDHIVVEITSAPQTFHNYYRSLVLLNVTNNTRAVITESLYLGITVSNTYRFMFRLRFQNFTFNLGDFVAIFEPSDFSDANYGILYVPGGSNVSNNYINMIIYNENIDEYRQVSRYIVDPNVVVIIGDSAIAASVSKGPVTGWSNLHSYSIRLEPPLFVDTITGGTVSTISVATGLAPNCINDFIRIRPTFYGSLQIAPAGETRRIASYDSTTKTYTLSPPFSATPLIGDKIEILPCSRDNLVPFSFRNIVSSEVTYNIELTDIVLPNEELSVGNGLKISFYPYIYIELTSVASPNSGSSHVVYSNNPKANRALFRLPVVVNATDAATRPYIRLNSAGMIQTITFKPSDTLHIRVSLNTGETYQTRLIESYSPYAPSLNAQISGAFALTPVGGNKAVSSRQTRYIPGQLDRTSQVDPIVSNVKRNTVF